MIRYRKGPENRVADALSRFPELGATCDSILVATLAWTQAVADSYQDDQYAQELLTKLLVDPTVVPHFSMRDGPPLQGPSVGGSGTSSTSTTISCSPY
jgi:hypothetical protein